MTDSKVYDWKQIYGDHFSKFNSDEGGNFSVYYPWLESLQTLKKNMSFFSIGGGYGALEAHIAKNFDAKFGFLEPTPSLYAQAQERFLRFGVSSHQIEQHQTTFQETEYTNQYDLVLAIHSWYYIGLFEEQFRKALAMIKPGGRLMIALSSNKDWDKQILNSVGAHDTFMTFENLKTWTDSINIPSIIHTQDREKKLDDLVKGGTATQSAQDWITYMARKPWEQYSDLEQKNLVSLFESLAPDGILRSEIGLIEYKIH